ncbi:MAG: DUF3551 domain-containing protein [Bradyrhizobium sp.]|uniref:DUF3551 domain-containing protein n=1 Tax=Bradyrhizobium sp. TaxID=376 RepID=UPI001C29C74C|nr:DUF3551 domain-containing protein [Bradyrhizobium sp.]MBU6462744.1 DUF3551 domain-containing protein [Pseudomonadota bacterium]MDE2067877.1 DUF3551 domain-containing protein [Bradyrhizobium sp.]MDE2242613.1 DUF3551 domain-containing protein [Bradyrhizobium sp.]MDE2471622.1 DUF3551 domain-containing protein [Bradyrhizobium sp.]
MRLIIIRSFAIILSVATLAITTGPAAAQDRYCLQGREWGYPGNCAFATYGQCMAAASGTSAGCGINPRHAYARQRSWYRRRGYHRY